MHSYVIVRVNGRLLGLRKNDLRCVSLSELAVSMTAMMSKPALKCAHLPKSDTQLIGSGYLFTTPNKQSTNSYRPTTKYLRPPPRVLIPPITNRPQPL